MRPTRPRSPATDRGSSGCERRPGYRPARSVARHARRVYCRAINNFRGTPVDGLAAARHDDGGGQQVHPRRHRRAGVSSLGRGLPEIALATELNTSRGTVREALRMLADRGLVDVFPRRGAFVSQLSPRAIWEITSLRALLEPYAARLASRRAALRGSTRRRSGARSIGSEQATVGRRSAGRRRRRRRVPSGGVPPLRPPDAARPPRYAPVPVAPDRPDQPAISPPMPRHSSGSTSRSRGRSTAATRKAWRRRSVPMSSRQASCCWAGWTPAGRLTAGVTVAARRNARAILADWRHRPPEEPAAPGPGAARPRGSRRNGP